MADHGEANPGEAIAGLQAVLYEDGSFGVRAEGTVPNVLGLLALAKAQLLQSAGVLTVRGGGRLEVPRPDLKVKLS